MASKSSGIALVYEKANLLQQVIAIKSFSAFRRRYLHQNYPDGPFHTQMMKDLEGSNRIIQAAPRYFAKTVIGARDWTIYCALTQKRKNIMILSATGSLSEDILRQIKHELEFNQLLVQDFGKQDTEKWTQDHCILQNGVQIRAKGIGYQIRGFHPDLFICDDLENDENIRSAEQREKLRDWFLKVVLGTVDEDAQLLVQGTVLHPLSLLAELLGDPQRKTWTRRKYRAIVDGQSIWPSRWPMEKLELKRQEIGSAAFQSEYLNDPLSVKDAIIQQQWIQYYDDFPSEAVTDTSGTRNQAVPLHYYLALDPSISQRESADPRAFVTLGVVSAGLQKGQIFVVNVVQGKWSLYETVAKLIELYQRYHHRVIGIETTAFQKAMKDVVLMESQRQGLYLPVVELKADVDKIRRLMDVSPLIENGQVKFRRNQFELIEQLVTMSPVAQDGHDDLVDALVYALRLIKERPFTPMVKSKQVITPPVYQPAMVGDGLSFTGY